MEFVKETGRGVHDLTQQELEKIYTDAYVVTNEQVRRGWFGGGGLDYENDDSNSFKQPPPLSNPPPPPPHTQCHRAAFDDQLSGTTGITVLILGKYLYIANVGDSRAIICSQHEKETNKVLAEPLSIDQTPFRKDERERVKKCGAKVSANR